MAKEKKFRLIDAILSVITVVLVRPRRLPRRRPSATRSSSGGTFLIIAFLLPYGLVVSELGTTYDDEGGLYDWVRRAFGDKWASRVSWYYSDQLPPVDGVARHPVPRDDQCSSRAWNWDFCPRF